jgi:hypothetical protein
VNFLPVFESSPLRALEWRQTVSGSPLRIEIWRNLRKADIVAYFGALLYGVETRPLRLQSG